MLVYDQIGKNFKFAKVDNNVGKTSLKTLSIPSCGSLNDEISHD